MQNEVSIAKVVAMAGSKGSKHSNRKRNPKYNKSDIISIKIDVPETSNIHLGGPRDPSDMNPEAIVNLEFLVSESGYTVNELEQLLYVKLDLLYTKAQDQLLKSGYSKAEVESAILNAGSTRGPMDIFNNVCQNAIAYMEKKAEPRTTAFKDLVELDKCTLKDMVDSVMETHHKQRGSAIWHLLVKNWGFIPSTSTISQLRSMDKSSLWFSGSYVSSSLSKNEDVGAVDPSSAEKVPSGIQVASASKKVGLLERVNPTVALLSHLRVNSLILSAVVKRKVEDPVIRLRAFLCVTGNPTEVPNIVRSDFLRSITDCSYGACLTGCLESNSDELKTALIVDLVKSIRELHGKVEEQKEWAKKKVIESARRLSKDVLELKTLRMMEFDKELNKQEKIYVEKSCKLMLMETEHGLRKMCSEVAFNTVKRLERENAQNRADLEALKLDESEDETELKEVLQRERRCMRKLTDVEKQTRIFQSQFEERKQRVVQLETELLEAEKEVYEAEMEWRRETTEKEHVYALLAEEMKNWDTQKANSRAQLLKLQHKIDIDSQIQRDDIQRLENDLSRLRLSNQMPYMFAENEDFWRDSAESSSSGSTALNASLKKDIRHWICMMCLRNEVSIVFLPCTHQVLCSPCYLENFKTVGGCCHTAMSRLKRSLKPTGQAPEFSQTNVKKQKISLALSVMKTSSL